MADTSLREALDSVNLRGAHGPLLLFGVLGVPSPVYHKVPGGQWLRLVLTPTLLAVDMAAVYTEAEV